MKVPRNRDSRRVRVVATLGAVWLAACPGRVQADSDALLGTWLTAATNLVTWEARVLQTRHLKAFTQPLMSTGRVWFAFPDRFRWELGEPPQSVALRSGPELTVLSPAFRRAETYRLDPGSPGPTRDLMGLLDTGFPRDAASFRAQFTVLGLETNPAVWRFRLEPRSASARRMLPELRLEIGAADRSLRATELVLADGSRLRNDFEELHRNVPLPNTLFTTNLDASWKLSRPGAPASR